jgi:hypothetical protein
MNAHQFFDEALNSGKIAFIIDDLSALAKEAKEALKKLGY